MLRFLPMLLILGLALCALIDCLARDEDEIRGLPKVLWVLVILLFPLLGSLAWFFAGRPRGAALPGPGGAGRSSGSRFTGGSETPGRRPVAPDDDPDFLRNIDEQRRRDRNPEEEDR
jgi:hypothetical protein